MQLQDSRVLISASDLMAFLECEHVTALDFLALGPGGQAMVRAKADESAELVARKGIEHEMAYLARLRVSGLDAVEIGGDGESLADKEGATLQAMRAGVDVVYQATLRQEELVGHADFLLKDRGGQPKLTAIACETPGADGLGEPALLANRDRTLSGAKGYGSTRPPRGFPHCCGCVPGDNLAEKEEAGRGVE